LYFDKIFVAQFTNIIDGGRIVSKIILHLQNNSNSHTFRRIINLLIFISSFYLILMQCFGTNINHKNVYIDKI